MDIKELSIGELLILDGCAYTVENVVRRKGYIVVEHEDEMDENCGPNCAERRILTTKQIEALRF